MNLSESDITEIKSFCFDWNKFARDILGVRLDRQQRIILRDIQENKRVSIRSGHARGKDYVAAVSSLCFLYTNYPAKVINTAPTGRQVISIMMAEISKIYQNTRVPLGGYILSNKVFPEYKIKEWYLEAFKAGDKQPGDWSGFHSPNIMVVATEASGLPEEVFESIEGLMTGNSKLVLAYNPHYTTGYAAHIVNDPKVVNHKLNCLDAPNVRAKKVLIPGQVDYEWVKDRIENWCESISAEDAKHLDYAFRFDGKWYNPNDIFLVRVMGEFPRESEDVVIPARWIDLAIERWLKMNKEDIEKGGNGYPLKLGVDVAGMGRDKSVLMPRRGNIVLNPKQYAQSDHMALAGMIKSEIEKEDKSNGQNGNDKPDMVKRATAYIDAIGEGAGVYSRCREQKLRVVAVKASEGANLKNARGKIVRTLTDDTRQFTFANMRAYLYWRIRDALDPRNEQPLALPPDDELKADLSNMRYSYRSNGAIIIEEKDEIKKRIGRSPDKGDALSMTFYPERTIPRVTAIHA